MKQKVIVLGYGFSSRLCIARALGAIGYEVNSIVIENSRPKPVDRYSKYINKVYYCHGNKEDQLMHILMGECVDEKQKVILFPVNDFTATVLDKNYNTLKHHFILPNIHEKQGAIIEWMNKDRQKKLASEVGLNVAKSVDVEIINRSYQIPSGIIYPCFTKTRAFTSGYKHTLQKCDNEKELKTFLDHLCENHENLTLMVEEYMEIEKEFAVVGLSSKTEVVLPGVIEILNMAQGGNKGIALRGQVTPCDKYQELIKKFKAFMKEIGFVGLFDIDFYLCNGKFYFGELNLRIGGSGFAVIKQGVNLPEMYAKNVTGHPIDDMKKEITESATYVNERICIENWYNRLLSTKQLIRLLHLSEISTIKDNDDRLPELAFYIHVCYKSAKRTLKKWLNK